MKWTGYMDIDYKMLQFRVASYHRPIWHNVSLSWSLVKLIIMLSFSSFFFRRKFWENLIRDSLIEEWSK
jgi:hypothetical protein